MRVLLRHQETGLYLQRAGGWDSNRETALEFVNAVVAYSWALEAKLERSEVVLTFTEPHTDLVCVRVQTVSNRPVINCHDAGWNLMLYSTLDNGLEIDLVDFDKRVHGQSCELLARAFALNFSLNGDSQAKTAYFRRNTDWTPSDVQAEAR